MFLSSVLILKYRKADVIICTQGVIVSLGCRTWGGECPPHKWTFAFKLLGCVPPLQYCHTLSCTTVVRNSHLDLNTELRRHHGRICFDILQIIRCVCPPPNPSLDPRISWTKCHHRHGNIPHNTVSAGASLNSKFELTLLCQYPPPLPSPAITQAHQRGQRLNRGTIMHRSVGKGPGRH